MTRVPADVLRRGPGAHDVHTAKWVSAHPGAVVCLHGLGGSHLNWALVGAGLTQHGTVWAPDLAGFGLTRLRSVTTRRRSARLGDNLDLSIGFIRTVSPDEPVILAGNSMGGLLALTLASRRPDLVRGLILVNPALPSPLGVRPDPQVVLNFAAFALPGVGERVLGWRTRRTTPEEQIAQTMALVAANPGTLDPELLALHVALARSRRVLPDAQRAFLEAARSTVGRVTLRRNRVWEDIRRITAPTLLLTGAKDRLVQSGAPDLVARQRPDWTSVRYHDLGHVPQLEAPERVLADVMAWAAIAKLAA